MSAVSNAERLARWLPDERCGALVTSPVSLRYLCGFPLENGIVLAFREDRFLFVTERDYAAAGERAAGFTVQVLESGAQLLNLLVKYGIRRIFTEPDKMTVAEYNVFKEQLHYAELDTSEALSRQLLAMRSVKTESEISAIAQAQKICDKAYERLLGTVRKGMTERQIASLLSFYLADFGADEPAFPAAALCGENTAKPNSKSSNRKLCEGDFLVLEFGAKYSGYCARMCRTVAAGAVDSRRENAYNAVSCAVQDGLKTLRGGIGAKVADSVVRSTLNAWGVDQYCFTGFTQGIGLEISEPPLPSQGASTMLKAGNALSASCGVRVLGKFGIKITDMAILTEEGCADLTAATKSLVHI